MLRKEYKQLVHYLKKDGLNSGRYYLVEFENGDGLGGTHSKLVDLRTTLIRTNYGGLDYRNQGVSVDIFIYDYLKIRKKSYLLHSIIAFVLIRLYKISTFSSLSEVKGRGLWLKRMLWRISKYIGTKRWIRLIIKNWEKVISLERTKYCGHAGRPMGGYVPSKVFDGYEKMEFEGNNYPCTAEWDSYLRKKYGRYMEYPPENKRYGHPGVYAYWKG